MRIPIDAKEEMLMAMIRELQARMAEAIGEKKIAKELRKIRDLRWKIAGWKLFGQYMTEHAS